ncbi:MAG: YceH family protein [Solirubrobacteraceae bacterium]
MDLSDSEIRVLGCLLEKQRTTPDHYPLSLNSLRLACNQATNRDPVVDYDENVIREALHRLGRRGYIRLAGASRAAKYRHLLAEVLPMTSAEQAVMCVLMLRGAQTPGELKQRGERIHAFAGLDEVHNTLSSLIERDLVARMDRRPGQKEERYTQLLGQDAEPDSGVGVAAQAPEPAAWSGASGSSRPPDLGERVERLEREVTELREAIAQLRGATAREQDTAQDAPLPERDVAQGVSEQDASERGATAQDASERGATAQDDSERDATTQDASAVPDGAWGAQVAQPSP